MKEQKKEKINFKENLSEYWSFLKPHKYWWTILIIIVLILETKRVVDRFLFKIIIDKSTEFTAGTISLYAIKEILIIIGIIFISFSLFVAVLGWVNLHLVILIENNMKADLKRKYFNHLISLDQKFHTTHKTGSMISKLMRSSGSIERMNDVILFNFAPLIVQLIVVTGTLAYFNLTSAIIILTTIVSFISFSLGMQKIQGIPRIKANKIEDIEKGNTADIFTNIESIKFFGKEKQIKLRFLNLTEKTKQAQLDVDKYYKWMRLGETLILSLGTFLILFFSIIGFLKGNLSIGTLTFIYISFGALIKPMYMFIHGIRSYYRAMADFQSLFKYGKIKKEITDKPNAKKLKIKKGEVEFKNITFGYTKRKLFKEFNLKINKNERIALVGHSGCGKSSLIKLLYRMYDVEDGSIKIDGKNIKDIKQESLRKEMAIVPQETILFDDTIYNNILFSNPSANRKEVLKAIKFAQLDKIIAEFPEKEKTIVGERGIRLSGGEKQRVSIARAILANKKILILDEATSALDSETEHEIQKDLTKLMKGRTSIIIAHRLSTIMHADKIIVIEKGKIVQMGTHNKLIKEKGKYKELWNLQKGGYIK